MPRDKRQKRDLHALNDEGMVRREAPSHANEMTFRLSNKLAAKLRVSAKDSAPLDTNTFADWSAHVFAAGRVQYILVTNTPSLYSVVMLARGITDDGRFLGAVLSAMREYMSNDGTEVIYRRFIAPAAAKVQFSKALNRSVTGSMNDLVYHATMWLTRGGLSPFDTSFKLNEIPFAALHYRNPREVFEALVSEQGSLLPLEKASRP